MAYSPFTSKGYPFPKDRENYESYDLGRAFFADGFWDRKRAFFLFDHINLLDKPSFKDEPLFYKKREIPVTAYVSSLSDMEAGYSKIELGYDELAVFFVKGAANPDNPLDTGIFAKVYLGDSILKHSKLDEAAMRTKHFPITSEDLEQLKKEVSAKSIVAIFNKDNALFAKEVENITGLVPKPKPKPKVHFTIGVFFDGTGNNRFNSEEIYYKNLCTDEENINQVDVLKYVNKEGGERVTTISSYWNPYSNVVLLHDMYKEKPLYEDKSSKEQRVILRQYVQGIGTLDGEKDDSLGSGVGEGERGIVGKVKEGCAELAKQIKAVLGNDYQIGSLTFDVFGFSRGAAAARLFCNEILGKGSTKELFDLNNFEKIKDMNDPSTYPYPKTVTAHSLGLLGDALEDLDVKFQLLVVNKPHSLVKIRFAGIFDTVVSKIEVKDNTAIIAAIVTKHPQVKIGIATLKILLDIKQNLYGLGIERVLHLTAEDEWRYNFPLTKTREGCSISVTGAHSDIGGGYAAIKDEANIIDYFFVFEDEDIPPEKIKLLELYRKRHYCIGEEIEFAYVKYVPEIFIPIPKIGEFISVREPKWLVVLRTQRRITPRYSIIPMRMMHSAAKASGVPFNDAPDTDTYDFEYITPKGLEDYQEAMCDYTVKMMNYKYNRIKQLKKPPFPKIAEKMKPVILNKFIHLSANYNRSLLFNLEGEGHTGFRTLDDLLYANFPAEGLKRQLIDEKNNK